MNGKTLFLVALAALLSPLVTFASINSPVDGVVIDESTGKPIAGAFVIAQWVRYGSDGFGSRTSCPHLEVVQSDDQGRYRIPKASVWGLGLTRMVFSYKAGYEWFVKGREPDDRVMSMQPFSGNGDQRLESYRTFGSLQGCGAVTDYAPKLAPLYRSIAIEARSLSVRPSQSQKLQRYIEFLEWAGDEKKVLQEHAVK